MDQLVLFRVLRLEFGDGVRALAVLLEGREEQPFFLRMVELARVVAQVFHNRRNELEVGSLAAFGQQGLRFEETGNRQ